MDAALWPYGKCEKCTNKNYCGWSNAEIVNCMNNGYQNFSPMTHGDEIRSLSDYDLADWIAKIIGYHGLLSRRRLTVDDCECSHDCPLYKCCNNQPSDNIEDWLKAPVEVDE